MKSKIIKLSNRYTVLIAFLFLFRNFVCSFAADVVPDYHFQQLTIEKGLSQSTVNCILTDHRGLMWIGTSSGLNSFDLHTIKTYFHNFHDPSSLPGNRIFFIAEDAYNKLWVGTDNGLVQYDEEKDKFLPIIIGKAFYNYLLLNNGILFCSKNRLYKYDYKKNTITTLKIKGDTSRKNLNFMITKDSSNILLADKQGWLWNYNLVSQYMKRADFCKESDISALFKDSKGNIYVSSYDKGLICYNQKGTKLWHLTSYNSDLTNNIILDMKEQDGKIWIATDGGGINILDRNMHITSIVHKLGDENSLPVNSILCLYKDQNNNIWAGSVRGGMIGIKEVFIKTFKDVVLNSPYGLSEKTVISLYEDNKGILWIGTDGGGLNSYDPYLSQFVHYPTTYNEKIVSITNYSDTELLLCLYGKGLCLFNKKSRTQHPFIINNPEVPHDFNSPVSLTYAFRVSNDKIYIISNHPYVYNIADKKLYNFKTNIRSIANMILIGVHGDSAYLIQGNELLESNIKTNNLHRIYALQNGETIKAACVDKNKRFWFATDNGLSYYDYPHKKFQRIRTSLFENVLTLQLDDKGRLWIGAQNMLFSYLIKANKFTIWGESDGFLPNELPYAYPPTSIAGNIYFGGVSGLVKINKEITTNKKNPLTLELMDIKVDGKPIFPSQKEPIETIKIPWNHSSLEIKVLAKEKDVFRKRVFRYSLNGAHNLTIDSYSHILNLQTLVPGTYFLTVSCSTKNGDWSPSQELLQIIVTPVWYKSRWSILIFIIIIIGVALFYMRLLIKKKERNLSMKMAENKQKINEERISFLININHELRTPLTLICAPLKRLLTNKQTEPNVIFQQLESVYKQATKMKSLIDMILDINKIKENKDVLHKKFYPLNEWVKSVCEEFSIEFESKRIELIYQLDDKVQNVPFDKDKCEIIFSNLLANAIKFSPSGTQLIVSTKLVDGYARISVSDQGIGLDNVDVNKLFTLFYQGNHDYHGSGIGLSYAKLLTEKHGGRIGAYNNIGGKGAVFYFELPVQSTQEIITESTIHLSDENNISIPNETIIPIDTHNYSILIVEDNYELRTFLKNELSEFKAVYTAEDGMKALEVVANRQPDIIVSDIMMPLMDGYELCRNIKQTLATSHIPVILLTARNDAISTQAGYSQGADAYLSKPFEINLLLTVIKNQLRNRELIKQKYLDVNYVAGLKPDQNNLDEKFLIKLNKVINDNLNNSNLDNSFLTDKMAMSRTALYNKIKSLTGMGANNYINRIRIEKAVQLFNSSEMSITEISEEVGFTSQRYFSTAFKEVKGRKCLRAGV